MAPRIVFYKDKNERKSLIAAAKALGESVKHDDFKDSQGNNTDGTSGRLEFDIDVAPVIPPEIARREVLLEKMRTDTINNNERNELIKIMFTGEL